MAPREHSVSSSPQTPRVDALALAIKRRAELRQVIWEAAQFMSAEEIREYVYAVLGEVESDEP